MSAIFGIIDFEGRPIENEWIKSMQNDLAHRGPDRQDLYQEESMFFGHMLLQVTPESVHDTSPYVEEGFVITAYARLDEREAIMDRLNTPQAEREIITDPLLLLRSFLKFGKDFVKDIYGDFAFAIWNKEKKELFCARDQMGAKPFLYYYDDNRFVFSTELKSIVNLPFVQTEIDNEILRNEAIGLCDAPTRTVWKNIFRLHSAHYLELDKTRFSISRYWDLEIQKNNALKTEEDWAGALKELLEKVISDHTRVLGEVGVPLSGGLDSSTIACIAARKFAKENKKIVSASSVLDDTSSEPGLTDEKEFINAVLDQEKNIDATYVYHSELKFIEGLKDKFDKQYAPVVHSHYVDEALYAKFEEKSVRRMLSGTLGDMTVSNSTVFPLPILLRKGRFLRFSRMSKRYRKNMKLGYYTHLKRNVIAPMLPFFLRKFIHNALGLYKPWRIDDNLLNLGNEQKETLQNRMNDFYKTYFLNSFDIKNEIWATDQENFAEDWDCGSSQHQIEISYPLLDRRIVEFMVQLPVEHFYMGGLKRGFIRKAVKNILPEKNRQRLDKKPYSPAYRKINRRDITEILPLLKEISFKKNIEQMLNCSKLEDYIVNINNSDNFTPNYWEIIDICVWVCFYHWVIQQKQIS